MAARATGTPLRAPPAIQEYRRGSRLTSIGSDFSAAVQLARAEAVKRQKIVSMCPTRSLSARSPSCSDEPNFAAWIVFEDGDGDCLPVAGAVPIRAEAAVQSGESGHLWARASGVCNGRVSMTRQRDTLRTWRVSCGSS